MIRFSVVLATYQGEKYITEQLDSIIAQMSPDDEIIVSDDASSDDTLELVKKRLDPRIRVLENLERVGYIGNFARAIDQVRGEYVFFSDQDDVWLPGKVEEMLAALRFKPFIASDAIVVDHTLDEIHRSFFRWRKTRSFSWQSIFLRPTIVGATMCCTTQYLRTLLPLPESVPHDFWLSFNAAWDGVLKVIPEPLILYRRHAAAFSPSGTNKKRPILQIATERVFLARAVLGRRLRWS